MWRTRTVRASLLLSNMKRSDRYRYILIAVAFTGITAAAILTNSDVYRIVPLYVSLLVMYLQTKASRFSFLLGGCNAAYYAGVYMFLGLYGIAAYSLLIACPIQIFAYIRWKKRAYGNSAVLKRLTAKQRVLSVVGFSALWTGLFVTLRALGSGYILLDNTISVISTASNIASLLYLIEFPYIQCVTHILNITLYVQMIQNEPKQWTYLIYTVYALICGIISAVYMHKLYNKQKKDAVL